jgi:hypothetical protein
MSQQSGAERLADALAGVAKYAGSENWETLAEAASELRRLHKVEKQRNELLKALQSVMTAHGEQLDAAFEQAQDAIAKAKGETQ